MKASLYRIDEYPHLWQAYDKTYAKSFQLLKSGLFLVYFHCSVNTRSTGTIFIFLADRINCAEVAQVIATHDQNTQQDHIGGV